jgi:hypothetical protein
MEHWNIDGRDSIQEESLIHRMRGVVHPSHPCIPYSLKKRSIMKALLFDTVALNIYRETLISQQYNPEKIDYLELMNIIGNDFDIKIALTNIKYPLLKKHGGFQRFIEFLEQKLGFTIENSFHEGMISTKLAYMLASTVYEEMSIITNDIMLHDVLIDAIEVRKKKINLVYFKDNLNYQWEKSGILNKINFINLDPYLLDIMNVDLKPKNTFNKIGIASWIP